LTSHLEARGSIVREWTKLHIVTICLEAGIKTLSHTVKVGHFHFIP